MKKINLDSAPKGEGTRYPAPYDEPCKKRRWVKLGDVHGLTQFGVNLVTLDPGVWSSQRHWHMKEDEFVYVLEGELVLVTDEGEEVFGPGDSAGFKAGVKNGHVFQNRSDKPAKLLAIGSRDDTDYGEYFHIEMKFSDQRYSCRGQYTRKNGEPI